MTADRRAVIAWRPTASRSSAMPMCPWLKPHQRLIDEAALPDGAALGAVRAVAERLSRPGYLWIGLDHFALPDDALAVAGASRPAAAQLPGLHHRPCEALIGFGASAIGALPQGYVQNSVGFKDYAEALARRARCRSPAASP